MAHRTRYVRYYTYNEHGYGAMALAVCLYLARLRTEVYIFPFRLLSIYLFRLLLYFTHKTQNNRYMFSVLYYVQSDKNCNCLGIKHT